MMIYTYVLKIPKGVLLWIIAKTTKDGLQMIL